MLTSQKYQKNLDDFHTFMTEMTGKSGEVSEGEEDLIFAELGIEKYVAYVIYEAGGKVCLNAFLMGWFMQSKEGNDDD